MPIKANWNRNKVNEQNVKQSIRKVKRKSAFKQTIINSKMVLSFNYLVNVPFKWRGQSGFSIISIYRGRFDL